MMLLLAPRALPQDAGQEVAEARAKAAKLLADAAADRTAIAAAHQAAGSQFGAIVTARIAAAEAEAVAAAAKKKRDDEIAIGCIADLDEARARAKTAGKQLVIWVGGCDASIRAKLPDYVHASVEQYDGLPGRNLVVPAPPGTKGVRYYYWSIDEVHRMTPADIRWQIKHLGQPPAKTTMPITYTTPAASC